MTTLSKLAITATVVLVAVVAYRTVTTRLDAFEKARNEAVTYSKTQAKKADSLLTLANASQARSDALTSELHRLDGVTTTLKAENAKLRHQVFNPDGSSALPDTCQPALDLIHGQDKLIDTLTKTVTLQNTRHGQDSTTVFNLRGSLTIQTNRADSLQRFIINIPAPQHCKWFGLPCPSRKTTLIAGLVTGVVVTTYLHNHAISIIPH